MIIDQNNYSWSKCGQKQFFNINKTPNQSRLRGLISDLLAFWDLDRYKSQ